MMGKLYLYSVFHANLNFSYIPKDFYPQIVRRCYWPLLRIVEEQQVPLGLEFSAYTLEVVNKLDPSFVQRLRKLWQDGACEVIGSGYVQSIMPLIPAQVNRENLQRGNAIYRELLGDRPTTAYVNEQVYSAGLPRLYREAGYQTLIVNWESSIPVHADPELRYQPCVVPAGDGAQIPVVWHSIVTYRAFQKYVEGEISLDMYLDGLLRHLPEVGERALPLYGSDWEVFDFKPWRAQPEEFRQPELGEMERIAGLLSLLKQQEDIEFITPGAVPQRFSELSVVRLESSANPLPYKKQDLHSVARWAVGGRDSVRLNSQCYELYQELLLSDWYMQHQPESLSLQHERETLWQELCFLWNSDFRTFTTEEKYLEFRNRMGAALDRVGRLRETLQPSEVAPGEVLLTNCGPEPAECEPVSFTISANGTGDSGPPAYELQVDNATVPCQVTQNIAVHSDVRRLTLEAIPALAAAQTGVGVIRQVAPSHVRRDVAHSIDTAQHVVETPSVSLQLHPRRGGAIDKLVFPQVCTEPLVCQIQDDLLQSAGLADHLFSGDLTLHDWLGRSITDHQIAEFQYPEPNERHDIFVPVRCVIRTELCTIWKTYRVYLHQPRVDLTFRVQWRDVVPSSFRVGRMILNPYAFDRSTLYYATTNGGEDVELFLLKDQRVLHDEPLSAEVTAEGCLGATEGWVVLGDGTKGIGFITRPAVLYSVPMVHYEELGSDPRAFLLMLSHSLGERDETSHTLWRGHSTWNLSILAGGDNVIAEVRTSASLSNGRLVARSGTDQG